MTDPISVSADRPAEQGDLRWRIGAWAAMTPDPELADSLRRLLRETLPAADRPVELRKAIDALLISVEALRDARPVEIQAKKRTVEAARAGIEERFASLLAKLIESELEKYTLQNGEIDELALWPDGRVTLIGGKEDYGYEVISVRKLLEGRQKT